MQFTGQTIKQCKVPLESSNLHTPGKGYEEVSERLVRKAIQFILLKAYSGCQARNGQQNFKRDLPGSY